MLKKDNYFLLANIFFLLMFVFALVFAQERFQSDGAYYLFKVIDSGSFQVEHQRYILAVSQVLPLIGTKLGIPVNTIVYLNSINNVVFFYLVFLYAVYFLKDRTAGIAVILFQCFGVLNIQFTPMYEVWYGTVLLVLVRSHIIQGRYFFMRDVLLLGAIMITVLFSHPLLFIPVLFVILFDALERWMVQWRLFFLVVFIFACWYIIKKIFLSPYEAGKISMLDFSWNKAYRDLSHPSYYWHLVKFFFSYYTIPALVYLLTMGYYIFRKAKGKAVLLSLFVFGHILLINLTHVMDWELTPYFERMYMPLIPVVFLPFLYDFFTQLALRNAVGAVLLILLVSWRIGRFVDVGLHYSQHTKQAELVIREAQKQAGSKFELNPQDYKNCMSWVDWSFAMETMLRSAEMDENHVVSVAYWEDFGFLNNRARLNEKDFMMRCIEVMPDYAMNQKYFHIRDGKYVLLQPLCQ